MASMSSSSAAGTSSSASAAAADSPYAQLELARKTLEDRLAKDEKWLSVGDAFIGKPAAHSSARCRDVRPADREHTASSSSEYIVPPNDSWAPMQKVRSAHLPDRLFESDCASLLPRARGGMGTDASNSDADAVYDGLAARDQSRVGLDRPQAISLGLEQ